MVVLARMRRGALALMLALPLLGASAAAAPPAPAPWLVRPERVKGDLEFLAGDALQGRGSATPDEAKAAAYVAAQFERLGLVRAPGMSSYLQTATILQPKAGGAPVLSIGGRALAGFTLLLPARGELQGRLAVAASAEPADIPPGELIALASRNAPLVPMLSAANARGARLLIVRETAETQRLRQEMGGEVPMPPSLEGDAPEGTALATLRGAEFDRLLRQSGQEVRLSLPGMTMTRSTTTNAIGFLPGTDPEAGVLLLSAHLDHLGRQADGTIMHGANDDASGVAAVLELARALAGGPQSRRGILFVCYGAEEMGGFGSAYFGAHPSVPLSKIAANIEFEMIGAQDPNLPQGSLMVTGFERSNLAEALAAHGALLAPDPYPDEHFFQRSDNYQLALKGVVAHTVSGWPKTPVYHRPADTIANLDFPYMVHAIESLIAPVRWLADSDFQPQWTGTGRPTH